MKKMYHQKTFNFTYPGDASVLTLRPVMVIDSGSISGRSLVKSSIEGNESIYFLTFSVALH